MLRDTRSYEVQIIDAVRAVNKALGGTYGTSPAIYKSEYNQYEVQLIDAIKGIGRTLSGSGLSLAGGGGGGVDSGTLQSLLTRVQRLENESFFRLDSGNITLKTAYQNLWVPGWMSAGGVGSSGGGGGSTVIVTPIVTTGTKIASISVDGVVSDLYAPSGGSGTVTKIKMNGTTYNPSSAGVVNLGTVLTSFTETDPTVPSWAKATTPSLYVGTTQVQTSSAAQALTGILSVNAESSSSSTSRIVWESANNAWHVYGNLYADGWVSAGGIGSSGQVATTLGDLSDVSLSSPSNGQALVYRNGTWVNETIQSGGSGTVTSVALSVPTGLSVSGSPVTTSGTIAISLASGYVIPQQSTLDGFVTLAGTQTITGAKTFSVNNVTLSSSLLLPATNNTSGIGSYTNRFADIYGVDGNLSGDLTLNSSSSINFGPVTITYDSTNHAIHVSGADPEGGTRQVGLYVDGFISAGGIQST